MKILYVTTVSSTINAFLVPHIQMLVKQGHQVDVACSPTVDLHPEILHLNCRVHSVPFSRSPMSADNLKAYKRIAKLVTEEQYDLVHTHTPVASFITRMACRKKPVKMLYTAHGFHFYKGAPWKNWILYYPLERLAALWTDSIITLNQEDFEATKSFTLRSPDPGNRFKMSGVGVDLSVFKPLEIYEKEALRKKYGYGVDDFILVYVGELNRNKNQIDLLLSLQMVIKDIPTVKLLLVGTGILDTEYRAFVKEHQLENHVHFMGWREDVSNLFQLADVAMSSSLREGLPVNIMEALASGLPCIASDCRGNRDLIQDGVSGYLVPAKDIKGYADAIKHLFHFRKVGKDNDPVNTEVFLSRFSTEQVVKELDDIYGIQEQKCGMTS